MVRQAPQQIFAIIREEGGMDGLVELADFEKTRGRAVAQQQSVWGSALLLVALVAATILVTTDISIDSLSFCFEKVRLPTGWGYMDTVFCLHSF